MKPRPDPSERLSSDGRLTRKERARIALLIALSLATGGAAGAGVGARLWSPTVAVTLAVLIGLSAGGLVLRVVLRKRKGDADKAD